MSKTEKIKELKRQINYEKRKMKVCAYGSSDLRYLYGLEEELRELSKEIKKEAKKCLEK